MNTRVCPIDCANRSGGECDGSMCMYKPVLEVLNDTDLERGASPSLTVVDEDYVSNGGW